MNHSRQRAMTLPELLTLVLLVAITAIYAVPSFSQWVEASKHRTLQETLWHHLQSARNRAVLQGQALEICPLSDNQQCGSDWNQGWILRMPASAEVLAVEQADTNDATLHWRGYQQRILFHRSGQTPSSNGRFYLCHDSNVVWQLVISRSGRIRQTSDAENQDEAYRCG
ncbi:Tfp pilus assembly protein FimT-like protein [Pseudomonas sp. 8Z]|uniref:GspH/FimT family protein n=1 Tax=Pseudomonas sp. 8Z TaxID=2653166 RepID=UPI0012F12AF5|nr:GspH/FimT family pseudopilin [Pseudomonas sp. 8Z]VXD02534.1 Tfp pilus assembly protein FimT-like protein [Pseudomonas sp. 8Z]